MNFDSPFFIGGLFCLDFCNTFDHRHTPPEYDFFPDRATLLEWGKASGILSKVGRETAPSDSLSLEKVREVRSLIFRLLFPLTRSGPPSRADLASFNTVFQETSTKMNLAAAGKEYSLVCQTDDPADQIVCTAVRSAADLLLSNRMGRVHQCRGCGWLFLDSTRNRSRQWCTMKICGNRAKARRHYKRVRQKKAYVG
jgi:predicted RNA-binding Zn ribbon-like protein